MGKVPSGETSGWGKLLVEGGREVCDGFGSVHGVLLLTLLLLTLLLPTPLLLTITDSTTHSNLSESMVPVTIR